MSADLQLPELPKLQISTSRIAVLSDQNDGLTTTERKLEQPNIEDESCRTPTSEESRIPPILICPLAPRKSKPPVSFKRKLPDDVQSFKVVIKEEIEAFFRSTYPLTKRWRRCT